MPQELNYLRETASQTAGPYVHIGMAPGAAGFKIFDQELGTDIAGPNAAGERIRVEGIVTDGTGAPVKDVLIEVWQANAAGIYASPADRRSDAVEEGFRGWGRVIPDFDTGLWGFDTVKPGSVMGRHSRPMAPHLNLWIVARGINIGLNTRMYFEGDPLIAHCPILASIPDKDAIEQLIAPLDMNASIPLDSLAYKFDIVLRGRRSTLFENRLEGN